MKTKAVTTSVWCNMVLPRRGDIDGKRIRSVDLFDGKCRSEACLLFPPDRLNVHRLCLLFSAQI